jgi:putative DNA methylase
VAILGSGKKLIEVALPLDAINDASAYDKMPGIGPHPKGLHKWWAPLPLPCARAILFASIIDDPASEKERESMFSVIRSLVQKKASEDEDALKQARRMITEACGRSIPTLVDPFSGSGAIPLEAQRLGLDVAASDLNPVAVLINKALLEIPLRFQAQPPVNPESQNRLGSESGWKGPVGLAEDIRYYGKWMREEAQTRIGHYYPKVKLPPEHGGREAEVIAWIWTRTVRCPNPACGAEMPLASTFWLSKKKGRKSWVEPKVDSDRKTVTYEVKTGDGAAPDPPKTGRGAKFRCIVCHEAVEDQYIKDEGSAGRMGARLMAIVADGDRNRIYLPPNETHERVETQAQPDSALDGELPHDPRNIWCVPYGITRFSNLFTSRQLTALTTFGDLLLDVRDQVLKDAVAAGLPDDGQPLHSGGRAATAYADSIATYLAMALNRTAHFNNSLCTWLPSGEQTKHLFTRQAIPMAWDFSEANILGERAVCWKTAADITADSLLSAATNSQLEGIATQLDARSAFANRESILVSTDPPYYDNIGYGNLSDFFYVWLRRSLKDVFPDLFSTLLTPKSQELVATPYRFKGDKVAAKQHFEEGLAAVFSEARRTMDPRFPMTVYYAFKQSESESLDPEGVATVGRITLTTGWETLLEALLRAGFQITATWPIRASQNWRMTSMGTNALATYIVLACRPRADDAPLATRKEFHSQLREELPEALKPLQQGSIAPVDLAQAAIGPGMAVFSRYSRVIEADGSSMKVRLALGIINQVLDEALAEHESDYDAATRWAVAWFDEFGFKDGPFGRAEQLSKAKNTAVDGMERDGILRSHAGKVRLLRRDELDPSWDPTTDKRLTLWEVTHHLVRSLDEAGESGASRILRKVGSSLGETAKDLAYRLYTICEKRKWADDALGYNALVVAWPEIAKLAGTQAEPEAQRLDI